MKTREELEARVLYLEWLLKEKRSENQLSEYLYSIRHLKRNVVDVRAVKEK